MSKVACLIVGENIYNNKIFLEYIKRDIYAKFFNIEMFRFMQKNDKELLFIIEDLAKIFKHLIVVSSCDAFSLIGKIVSTITEDVLILKNGMLIPSKADKCLENSYLLTHKNSTINILKAVEGKILPTLLEKDKMQFKKINIIEKNATKYKVEIEKFSKIHNIKISISSLLSNWICLDLTYHEESETEAFIKDVKELSLSSLLIEGCVVEYISKKLNEKNEKVSFVESYTNGELSSFFTSKTDNFTIFKDSFITYLNSSKKYPININVEIISTFGKVSLSCLKEMLKGSLNISHATYAVGILGPNEKNTANTIFIGVMKSTGEFNIKELLFKGDRHYMQSQSVLAAVVEFISFENSL